MIELKCLNAAELVAFVDAPDFVEMEHLPISRHRGHSHAGNPRANAADILLLLAYLDSQMVGYLGVLPERLYFGNAREARGGWLSCIWVDPQFRGKGVSKLLVNRALELYEGRILMAEFTAPAGRLFGKMGAFMPLQRKEGLRLYQRLDLAAILPTKGGIFARLQGLWRVGDALGNAVLDLRFLFASRKLAGLKLDYIQQIDAETAQFIAARQQKQLFRRNQAELDWMTSSPWIKVGDSSSDLAKRYAFSSFAKKFEFVQVKVHDSQGKLRIYMMFSLRNHNLKVNYCYCDAIHFPDALKVLRFHLLKWKIKTAIIYQPGLVQEIKQSGLGSLHKKTAHREYQIGKIFATDLEGAQFEIQDGDGDCGFT